MNTQTEKRERRKQVEYRFGELAKMPPEMLLSIKGLAEAFGVTMRTIHRMRDRCELPGAVKIGKRRFWRAGRVSAWFDKMAEEAERLTERQRRKIAAYT